LLHVAIGTGHPGGGIYPKGLCREGAEDVEHPTEFLLKAHGHVVELVESCINLLLPRLEDGCSAHLPHTPHCYAPRSC
jgi:hypothetical protein